MGDTNEKKTLVPELLPAPATVVSRTPRERVAAHLGKLKHLGVIASAATLANCGYMVVDPLPPPAQCRTLDAFRVNAFANRTDRVLSVTLTFDNFDHPMAEWTFGEPSKIDGGTLQAQDRTEDGSGRQSIVLRFLLDPGAELLTFAIPADCAVPENGSTSASLATVTVELGDGADAGTDAGVPHGPLPVQVTVSER